MRSAIHTLFILFLLTTLIRCGTKVPERFEGKMVYKITSDRTEQFNEDSLGYQVVYAKDSMLRVENFTQLGKQVYIKHITKNRAYILMEFNGEKVAIRSIPEPPANDGKYEFKKKRGKETIAGRTARKMEVKIPHIDSLIVMYYFDDISHDYSEAIPGLPGLPVKYTLLVDAELAEFELILFEQKEIHIDYFGIPSDYKIMTMDEFIESFQN
jgi:hypothetical protein